ncbi:MAG: zf-HC2 domain-containing protein [Candidatus Theseobacter exili]|nr:zf-HC2 domain-containing protein [Candidatus Theseobacter exili]
MESSSRCKYYKLVGPFVDNELSDSQKQDMALHVENCAECFNEVNKAQQTGLLIRENLIVEPTNDAMREIWENIHTELTNSHNFKTQQKRSVLKHFNKAKFWISAAAALIVISVGTLFYSFPYKTGNLQSNHCFVESIDSASASIMVFETPKNKMTVFWIFENESSS